MEEFEDMCLLQTMKKIILVMKMLLKSLS